MNRLLILFAHPALHKSRVHRQLIRAADGLSGVTLHDLYEEYPTLAIDVAREQTLLLGHDTIIFQHPFYWYSCPAMIKEWLDLVLEHGFAYGNDGVALHGKTLLSVISTGGPEENYQATGAQRFTIRQFLAPFEQTANLCGMEFLVPFVVHGTHQLTSPQIASHVADYRKVLIGLRDGVFDKEAASQYSRLNANLHSVLPSAFHSL